MKIIINKYIPFKGFIAINLFGVLFVREENRFYMGLETINHETIHTKQMQEMGYIFFYIWYCIEYIIKLIFNIHKKNRFEIAYKNISFEQEAYLNDNDMNYIPHRTHYNWIKYIF